MIQIGTNDECDRGKVSQTTSAMLRLLSNGCGFKNLNEVQRAGIYILCSELSNVCHSEHTHKFQNLAYVLGVTDPEDIKKILMENINDI